MTKIISLTALGIILAATNAMATLIDFEGVTAGQTTESNSTRTFNGFDVFVPHGHYEDVSHRGLGGTDYLLVDHYSSTLNLGFGVSANDGSAFSLQSIDVSEWEATSNNILTVTGQLFGGGSISTQFTTDSSSGFETFSFASSWSNLVSVNFTDFTTDNNTPYGQLAFDNIVLNEPTSAPVPEPTTMLLFGAGLAGLVGSRTRKKKQQ